MIYIKSATLFKDTKHRYIKTSFDRSDLNFKFKLASTDEDRTVETCFDVPMFSVFKEHSTFAIDHALKK